MNFRPATRADFLTFYGRLPPVTVRAVVADDGEKPIGVGGYYLKNGVAVAFTNQRGMTKRQMVKAGRVMMQLLAPLDMNIVAGADGDGTVLRHFGFEPYGEVWRLR